VAEETQSRKPKLAVEKLSLSFGGVKALDGVSLDVFDGELLAIIGPNGAGKTSLINSISGYYRPQQGEIRFGGRPLTRMKPHEIPTLGIARTFQNMQLFTGMTTLENLLAARHAFFKSGFLAGGVFFGRSRREEVKHRRVVEEIIDFLEMETIRKKVVGTLPYGLRKRVDLGRALAMEPKLVLLDEPMAGMNLEEKEDMARFIIDILEEMGTTVILIEHDMGVVMDIADRVAVLDFGRKIADGSPGHIKGDAAVVKAYLGEEVAWTEQPV
jgi:branched-chain amino acid transport system ATP-binding protein